MSTYPQEAPRPLRVLALEAYYGGSHKAFLDGWIADSRHDWTLLTLPDSKWKWRMRRLDHSMIFVLIAGTYTPISWIALDGWLRVATLVVIWTIALVGIGQQVFFARERSSFAIALMTTMGWLAVFIMIPFFHRAGAGAATLMALGGILYTVGMVFLVTNKPRLWPRIFSYHELFHVMVVAATSLHFVATWRYVVPLAA